MRPNTSGAPARRQGVNREGEMSEQAALDLLRGQQWGNAWEAEKQRQAGLTGALLMAGEYSASPQIGDIVLVEWVDSSRTTDWTFDEPDLTRSKHQSVGYLSHQNDEAVTVRPHRAIDKDGAEQHVGDMTIPRCCITRISVLSSLEMA